MNGWDPRWGQAPPSARQRSMTEEVLVAGAMCVLLGIMALAGLFAVGAITWPW